MDRVNQKSWHDQAVAAARAGDNQKAFELLRHEIVFNPASQAATCDGFTLCARSGSWHASKLAVWAVRLNPLFVSGWRNMLSGLDKNKVAAQRRAIARHAVPLTIGNGPDTRRIGEVFMGLGDFSRAARMLSWAAFLGPVDVTLWFALAQSRFQIKDHLGALVALDKARDAGLPREQELFWRARLLLATCHYDEADAVIDQARQTSDVLAARCRILMHTARISDFKTGSKPPSR